jgi:hypothetical protein
MHSFQSELRIGKHVNAPNLSIYVHQIRIGLRWDGTKCARLKFQFFELRGGLAGPDTLLE